MVFGVSLAFSKDSVSKARWLLRRLLFLVVDALIPKNGRYWVFPVYFIGEGSFSDNMLAVFMEVRHDPEIKKIILTRNKAVNLSGSNVLILPMNSYAAALYMLRARVWLVQHSVWLDFSCAKFQLYSGAGRYIINLWHGVPVKSLAHENTGIHTKRGIREMPNYRIITSSYKDKKNMQSAFMYTPDDNFWVTGIPRNDFMHCEESALPDTFRTQLLSLDKALTGRKLMLYAPTYRETEVGGGYYDFSIDDVREIEEFCRSYNFVFGVRHHIYRKPECFQRLFESAHVLDLSADVIDDVRLLMRRVGLLVTDYSSVVVDAIYSGVPFAAFSYDLESYKFVQRGFFYEYKDIFKERIFKDFDGVLGWAISESIAASSADVMLAAELGLFDFVDSCNSKRVVLEIQKLAYQ